MSTITRRSFLRNSSAFAATAASLHITSGVRAQSPNGKFTIGIIGPGGMGTGHLKTFAKTDDVDIAYVCDVDQNRLAAAVKNVEAAGKKAPKAVGDLRRILEDKSVDAVVIAMPDHWHAPATLLACDAGKHVYVEKPGSHNIREGRLMIEAARRTKRVVQVGTQTRSSKHMMEATEKVRSGAIGDVLECRVWNSQLRRNIGKSQPEPVPAHLDYENWIGPAPMVPYRKTLLPGIWRWHFAFGTGDMGNDGVHDLDVGLWGLNVGFRHPSRIAALGGKYFFDDDQQFPDTQTCLFEYDMGGGKKKQLIYEQTSGRPTCRKATRTATAGMAPRATSSAARNPAGRCSRRRTSPSRRAKARPTLPRITAISSIASSPARDRTRTWRSITTPRASAISATSRHAWVGR